MTDSNSNWWYRCQQVLAAFAILVFLPLFVVIGLLVKLTSKGPIFYSQERPGLHGKKFRAWKFRSMRPGSDKDASKARGVMNNDPQVTTIGRIIRNLKLDELPQLWNVVRGDMALVGPRPIASSLHDELCKAIPDFNERLSVHPGLTNLGQICIDENADQAKVIADWKVRFEAEKHYLRNRSVFYDTIIILMTVMFILRKVMRAILPARTPARPSDVTSKAANV